MRQHWQLSTLLVVACAACDQGDARTARPRTTDSQSLAPREDVVLIAAHEGAWQVRKADSEMFLDIEMRQQEAVIRYQEMTLRGEIRSGSRRYQFAGEREHFAKVKRRGATLLLNDRDAAQLWKVEIGNGRVEISKGKSEQWRYAIVAASGGSHDVFREAAPLGSVTLDAPAERVSVRNVRGDELYWGRNKTSSALWGVLLMTDIPEAHRFIIMAEIGARGR